MAATKTKTPKIELDLHHADGCPAQRTESWNDVTPEDVPVRVARCLDCPAHEVEPERS